MIETNLRHALRYHLQFKLAVKHCFTFTNTMLHKASQKGNKVMGIKAVRFSNSEEQSIKDFLIRNPQIDFSTLARIAISNFIENPTIHLVPVKIELKKEKRIQQ